MTAFCGCFHRQITSGAPAEARNNLLEIKDRARVNLTRNRRHFVREYLDARMFLLAYDNGAWGSNDWIKTENISIAWVSGNPLIAGEDGVSNRPADSAAKVIASLASNDMSALARTAGGFSAVLWDSSKGKLRLCSDKLASRPLYVYLDRDSCYFASSIRVLRIMLAHDLDIDDEGLSQFIYFSQNLRSKTIFKNVSIVSPGAIFEVSAENETNIKYFNWNEIPPRQMDIDSCSRELYSLFIKATRRRIINNKSADAFLTGGMDSRCVVAALLDSDVKVRAFNYSYPDSADDILGHMLAEKLQVEYICYHSSPKDRLKINTDFFAMNAKAHFPRAVSTDDVCGRLIWSGDGGSVGLGHVYITEENVNLTSVPINESSVIRLFPGLNRPISRLISGSLTGDLREHAIRSVVDYFNIIEPTQPSRKIFLFYLLNDQMRHLYHHYEQIDLSDIEFEMPFFDMDLIEFIVSLPVDFFLGHRLYNRWLSEFTTRIDQTPWQAYPGHEPCPLPLPKNILTQWGTDWYGGKNSEEVSMTIIASLLRDPSSATWRYIQKKWLYALFIANSIGIHKYNYEAQFARTVYEEISGKLVFDLPM